METLSDKESHNILKHYPLMDYVAPEELLAAARLRKSILVPIDGVHPTLEMNEEY